MIEAELELGRHALLIGELEALVAAHPYQERLHALLMLALFRSGRQAEALRAYQAVRESLSEELGLQPGTELRELEAAILRQDDALVLDGRPTPTPTVLTQAPEPAPTEDAHARTVHPAGDRRIVAVLIADVVDSTVIDERLGLERSKFFFDEVVRLMAEQIRRYGGTVAQLTGDGVLAIFGAPVAHEDDSERAVRAARAIHDVLAGYAREVEEPYGVRLAGRVGVNTGPVVIVPGDIPDEARYNALGNTVNIAARLQALAGEGGVAVGPSTARQIERRFRLEALGEVELKGRQVPLSAFLVVGEVEGEPALAPTRFVGRESDFAVLTRLLEELLDGRGAIASITGEAGIGKTRLVAEARGRFDGIRFLSGHAVSYADTIPYWPVRELVRDWLGLGASDPEARVRLELRAGLARLLVADADDVYPFLAGMLGSTLELEAAERLRQLSRDSIQRQTIDGVYRVVAAVAAEGPLCLVLEDLHWADDSTFDLLEELLGLTEEAGVLLLLLYRSEREHRCWDLGQHARRRHPHRSCELELGPLDGEASRELADSAAGGEVPAPLAELLAERAGGNPFFLEEALRDLVERGALRRENDHYELAVGMDALLIPELVQEALQARLERLEPETRQVLNVAAVVGNNFGLPLLERVAPRDALLPALAELQRLELVVEERRRPAPEYRFRHGLVQEVAYASLLGPRRRELHRGVGRALEELHEESPAEAYGLLARHFSEADEPEQAIEYLLKAGDAARAVYANEEALAHYAKALGFLRVGSDAARARDTLLKVALTHHLAFDFEQAGHAYAEAFALQPGAPQRLEPVEQIEVLGSGGVWDFVPAYTDLAGDVGFAHNLFRGLLAVDRDGNVVPELAESLAVSADGRGYTFRLRADARWSDGRTVSADDFVYAWEQIGAAKLPTSDLLDDIEDARTSGSTTLEVRLREPRNYFPYILAMPAASPWPRHLDEIGDAWRQPTSLVGNGPFLLSEFAEDSAVLDASPHWPGAIGNVGHVRMTFARNKQKVLDLWRAGRGDLAWEVTTSAETSPGAETVAQIDPVAKTEYVGYDAHRPPFDDVRVRKAFSHAVDRSRLLRGTVADRPAGLGGFLPPTIPGHSHRIAPAYDPELGRALLAEAGFPEGVGLPEIELAVNFWMAGWRPALPAADLAEQWAALGARVRLRVISDREFMDGRGLHDPRRRSHAWYGGWVGDFPDPDGMIRGLLDGYPLYQDEHMLATARRARSLADQPLRIQQYREFDRLLVSEHSALVPLSYGRLQTLRRPWVLGVRANPLVTFGESFDHLVIKR